MAAEKLIATIITEKLVTQVADESIIGIKEVVGKFACNYTKRRNVGFGVIDSATGSYRDTRRYYNDLIVGREPHEMIEAVIFDPVY